MYMNGQQSIQASPIRALRTLARVGEVITSIATATRLTAASVQPLSASEQSVLGSAYICSCEL